MELLERYLAAIGRQLPRREAGDIVAELRDTLLSRVEEREAVLGHPLDRAEQEALLIGFGHPLVVAGRFRRVQHLIGPEVFPFWWAFLKLSLAIVAAIYLVTLGISAVVANDARRLTDEVAQALWVAGIFTFGAVTLFFAVLELLGLTRMLTRWRPRTLPPVKSRRRSPFEQAVEIAMGVVVILWWVGLLHFRELVPIPHFLDVRLAAIWGELHTPILAYFILELAVNLLGLLRPGGVRLNAALAAAQGLAGAVIAGLLLQGGHWVDVDSAVTTPHGLAELRANFDLGLRVGLTATALVLLAKAGLNAWRAMAGPRA